MKYKAIAALLIIVMLIAVTTGYTQTMRKTGLSGASILKVGVGAKAVAMGSAVTTETGDVNQIFWNPAGISLDRGKTQVTFSYNNWLVDLNHNAFAVAHSFGNIGTFAIGGMMSGVGDIASDRDYVDGLEIDYGGGATFDFNTMCFALGYAKQFTDKLSLGATAKYYREEMDVESASAVAFDFGAIYKIGYRDLTIGARIQNLGKDMKYYFVDYSLPLVFSFGVSMSMIQSDFFNLKGFADATKPLDTEQLLLGGLEATLYKTIHVRTGYKFNYSGIRDEFDDRASYQRIEDQTRSHWWNSEEHYRTDEGLSVGAGIQIPYGDYELVVDYSWTAFRLLDDVNRLSLTIKF
jgi:hypothetical protein